MLTTAEIEKNKSIFLNLISQINIPNADIQGLTDFLINSDFFSAPASTQYHCNYEGGLCQHSLNVYKNLVSLSNQFAPNTYESSTLIAVGLLHDLAKVNFYEKFIANKKIYNPKGTKHDNQGNFDWFAEESYRVKDASDRYLAGDHGTNSLFLANNYIPFTLEESLSILHHHCGMSSDGKLITDQSAILNKYPLVTLLHSADFLATFIDERS